METTSGKNGRKQSGKNRLQSDPKYEKTGRKTPEMMDRILNNDIPRQMRMATT